MISRILIVLIISFVKIGFTAASPLKDQADPQIMPQSSCFLIKCPFQQCSDKMVYSNGRCPDPCQNPNQPAIGYECDQWGHLDTDWRTNVVSCHSEGENTDQAPINYIMCSTEIEQKKKCTGGPKADSSGSGQGQNQQNILPKWTYGVCFHYSTATQVNFTTHKLSTQLLMYTDQKGDGSKPTMDMLPILICLALMLPNI